MAPVKRPMRKEAPHFKKWPVHILIENIPQLSPNKNTL
jgi:hypothetical protein